MEKGKNITKKRPVNVFKDRYLIYCLLFIFILIIYFSVVSTLGSLSIDEKNSRFGLSIYNDEKAIHGLSYVEKDQFGNAFRWSEDRSKMNARARGSFVVIPVFNNKPDINSDPISINVYINGEKAYEYNQNANEEFDITINIAERGIGPDEFFSIVFLSDNSWIPSEYGLSDDDREISFAIKSLDFIE